MKLYFDSLTTLKVIYVRISPYENDTFFLGHDGSVLFYYGVLYVLHLLFT